MSISTKCIISGCDAEAQWKGLCRSCYGQAIQLIKEDKTTWEELTSLGLAVVADKPFIAEFKKKKGIQ